MKETPGRLVYFAAIVLLQATLALGLLRPQSASAQLAPPANPPVINALAGCVAQQRSLLVLFLIDTSGSLKGYPGSPGTDPTAQRVAGIKAALLGLGRLANAALDGSGPRVETLLAGFSVGFQPSTGWVPVGADTLPSLEAEASAYASRNTGLDTDYATALIGAKRTMDDRAAQLTDGGGVAPCKAIVWFTDGKYDVGDRNDPARRNLPATVEYAPGLRLDTPGAGQRAVDAGIQYLCQPGGFTDQMRSDGIVTFTVALSTQLSPADGAFLNSVTTGSGGAACGSTGTPATGLYIPVSDADSLVRYFADLFPPQAFPPSSCAGGYQLTADVSRFVMLASTGADGAAIRLSPPSGAPVSLQSGASGQVNAAGASLGVTWLSANTVDIEGVLPPSSTGWQGNWAVDLGASGSAAATCELRLYSDIAPQVVGTPSFVIGAVSPLRFQLVDSEGNPVPPVRASQATLTVAVQDPVASNLVELPVSVSAGMFTSSYAVPTATTAAALSVDLGVSLPSSGSVPIATQGRVVSIPTRLPDSAGYPTISPANLVLPSVVKRHATSGVLTLTGSTVAGGCVWVDPARLTIPDGAGKVAMSSAPNATNRNTCVHVGKGQVRQLTIQFTPDHRASGRVSGSLTLQTTSDVTAAVHTVVVQTSFEMGLGPPTGAQIGLAVLLFILGLIFPILVLHGFNLAGARFEAAELIRKASYDVMVAPGQPVTGLDGKPLRVSPRDFEVVGQSGRPRMERSPNIDAMFRFRTHASASFRPPKLTLFTGSFGTATAAGGGPILSGSAIEPLRTWRNDRICEVPRVLRGTWLFAPTGWSSAPGDVLSVEALLEGPDDQPTGAGSQWVEGRLLMLIKDGEGLDQGPRLLAAAQNDLPGKVGRLQQPAPPWWRAIWDSLTTRRQETYRRKQSQGDLVDGQADLDAINQALSSSTSDEDGEV